MVLVARLALTAGSPASIATAQGDVDSCFPVGTHLSVVLGANAPELLAGSDLGAARAVVCERWAAGSVACVRATWEGAPAGVIVAERRFLPRLRALDDGAVLDESLGQASVCEVACDDLVASGAR